MIDQDICFLMIYSTEAPEPDISVSTSVVDLFPFLVATGWGIGNR